MNDDVICRIIAGDLPAEIVCRTETAIAFLDHRPLFPGHVLVSPLQHADTLVDLSADLLAPVMGLAQRVCVAVTKALGAQGSFVAVNNVVSQSVPHLHVHVVPRTKGDGLRGFFWPRRTYADGEAADVANRLREHLRS